MTIAEVASGIPDWAAIIMGPLGALAMALAVAYQQRQDLKETRTEIKDLHEANKQTLMDTIKILGGDHE